MLVDCVFVLRDWFEFTEISCIIIDGLLFGCVLLCLICLAPMGCCVCCLFSYIRRLVVICGVLFLCGV